LWAQWEAHRGDGMRRLMAALDDTGLSTAQIERFLSAEPTPGHGSIRDLAAAEMSNQLLSALGQPARQDGASVKRLRERGEWRRYGQRPEG
jgi:hypothetical protein